MSFLGFGTHDNAVAPLTYTRMQLPGQPAQTDAERTDYFPTLARDIQPILSDPRAQVAIANLQRYGENSSQGRAAMQTLRDRQQALGVNLPSHTNWAVTPDGRIGFRRTDVNADYVYPIATLVAAGGLGLGAASAAGAFGGGAAAGGGSAAGSGSAAFTVPASVGANIGAVPGASAVSFGASAPAWTVPASVGANVGAIPGATSAGSLAAPAATNIAASSSPWLSNSALGVYSSIGQSIAQAYSANRARDAQQAATDQAIAFQREIFNQQQANEQPYMQAGSAALNRLNTLLTPAGQPLTPIGQKGPNQMVMVVSPTGQRMLRPASEIAHWQQLGATIENDLSAHGGQSLGNLVSAHGGR